jgi:hypothetical protein
VLPSKIITRKARASSKRVTAAALRQLLQYDQKTGRFFWREHVSYRCRKGSTVAGAEAGSPSHRASRQDAGGHEAVGSGRHVSRFMVSAACQGGINELALY